MIPVYAIFAALFWGRVLERLMAGTRLVFAAQSHYRSGDRGHRRGCNPGSSGDYPSHRLGFSLSAEFDTDNEHFAQESAMVGGAPFRGRTANMIGRSIDHSVDWLDLHAIDGSLSQTAGNELRLVGLNYFGIPSLFEYTSTITPFFYALTSRLLARPGDRQMRSIVVLRRIDPRILAMLGVRFVITDREYGGPARIFASASRTKIELCTFMNSITQI